MHDAQRAVVEFLLINHPLDCPVCDKGGECPLQDITYGWGPGTSRFIEPKRHFKKPLELSPLIAIDRERCILCYRCVRFSQEISEDYQLILLERGAHSFVGTFDGHPYVAPFSGNIVELCPVGALTSRAYRFRARPWDIEGAGTVCTLCPAQCNVELTVRDDRVMRVLARDNDEVDDGWLCDKGRFAYQSRPRRRAHHRSRSCARAPSLMPAIWEKALDAAGERAEEGRRQGRRAGRRRDHQRGGVPARSGCSARGSAPATSRRAPAASCRSTSRARSPTPRCRRRCPTSSSPTPCCCSTATRSTTRRSSTCASARACAATACGSAVASARPTALDPNADVRASASRRARRGAARRARRRADRRRGNLGGAATAAGSNAEPCATSPPLRRGEDIVIVYGERRCRRARAARGAAQPRRRGSASPAAPGAGLLEIPVGDQRRAACARPASPPATAPATRRSPSPAATPPGSPPGSPTATCRVLYLLHADPLRTHPDRALWEARARHRADRDRRTSRC